MCLSRVAVVSFPWLDILCHVRAERNRKYPSGETISQRGWFDLTTLSAHWPRQVLVKLVTGIMSYYIPLSPEMSGCRKTVKHSLANEYRDRKVRKTYPIKTSLMDTFLYHHNKKVRVLYKGIIKMIWPKTRRKNRQFFKKQQFIKKKQRKR